MIKAIRLTLSIFFLSGCTAAQGSYEPINTKDFVAHPEIYEGRLVEVRADVIAIGADSKSLQLFDGETRMMIGVTLTQLSKAQRSALMLNPVRHLLVYGQATVKENQLVIDAHEVQDLQLEPNIAGVITGDVGAGGSLVDSSFRVTKLNAHSSSGKGATMPTESVNTDLLYLVIGALPILITILYLDRYLERRRRLGSNGEYMARMQAARFNSSLHQFGRRYRVNRWIGDPHFVDLSSEPNICVSATGFSRRRIISDRFGRVVATHYEEYVMSDHFRGILVSGIPTTMRPQLMLESRRASFGVGKQP